MCRKNTGKVRFAAFFPAAEKVILLHITLPHCHKNVNMPGKKKMLRYDE
jgi:hypothetical protein